MILEIWSTADRFFSHFGPFFALLHPPPLNNPKNQSFEKMIIHYTVLEIWRVMDAIVAFHFGQFFALSHP